MRIFLGSTGRMSSTSKKSSLEGKIEKLEDRVSTLEDSVHQLTNSLVTLNKIVLGNATRSRNKSARESAQKNAKRILAAYEQMGGRKTRRRRH